MIEACSACGWIADLAESLSIEVRVANVLGEAWKWKRVKRKTDRDDWCWALLRDGSEWDQARGRSLTAA